MKIKSPASQTEKLNTDIIDLITNEEIKD